MLYRVTEHCSVLQCFAVFCSVLQCVALCCSMLQCEVFDDDRVEELRVYLLLRVHFSNCNLISLLSKERYVSSLHCSLLKQSDGHLLKQSLPCIFF